MHRKAVVAGATGLIGKALVQLLLSEQAYSDITLIVRRPTGIVHPKLHETVVDFDRLAETDVNLAGADVFCTLGTTMKKARTKEAFRHVDFNYPLALGRMANTQGASQFFIVTAMGANPSSPIFYNRVKGEVEEALRGLGLPALHIFRPSLLLGSRTEFRMGERIASSVSGFLSPFLAGPLRKYRPVQARAVAEAMVFAAQSGLPGNHLYESDRIAAMESAHGG